MNLYLDDNTAGALLVRLLRRAGHSVMTPPDASLSGVSDVRHLEFAIRSNRRILTRDRGDFRDLHQLLATSGGQHWGILLVCYENDPKRDMTERQITAAVTKLERSGLDLTNQAIVLNQWR